MKKIKRFSIQINRRKVMVIPGQTVLQAARDAGIDIPALCYHPDLGIKANCRLCLVQVQGLAGLQPACALTVQPKMIIKTESAEIARLRKINLELLMAEHIEKCAPGGKIHDCALLALAKKYRADIHKYPERKRGFPVYEFGPALKFHSSRCIDCRNCVEACHNQGVDFLELKQDIPGCIHKIVPTKDPKRDCVYCGQCLMHCPVGAFEEVNETRYVEQAVKNKKKITVFQFAPAIRTSIGEEFDLPAGSVVTGQLAAACRKLGADYVFDVTTGADFTTFEEAKELIEKIKKHETPCFSSCCPSWVKYIEFNYPEYISHVATTRSPQIILGGLVKTYWAEKMKLDPRDIMVVSIMPCLAKKYEIRRPENLISGLKPVDHVITTREFAGMLKARRIDLRKIKPENADSALGVHSGAGVIYGASGGVMESALRTAAYLISNGRSAKIDFKQIRGQEGIKRAEITLAGRQLRVAVVNGLGNAKIILDELKQNPQAYAAVEVMACPGGCIGGGGQPLPCDAKIRQARADALYSVDRKKKIRAAHRNPVLKKVYQQYLINDEIIHHVCHTSYSAKKREVGAGG